MAKKKEAVKPVEEATPVKFYRFTSDNKFLTVTSLGVQFINGKAETDNPAVARALTTIDGVELIED